MIQECPPCCASKQSESPSLIGRMLREQADRELGTHRCVSRSMFGDWMARLWDHETENLEKAKIDE